MSKPRRAAAAAEEVDAVEERPTAEATAAPTRSRRAAAAANEEADAPEATAAPKGGRRKAGGSEEVAEANGEVHVDPTATAAAPAVRSTRRVAGGANATEAKTADASTANQAEAGTTAQIDYDAMTYDQFLVQLRQRSKREVMEALKSRSTIEAAEKKNKELEPFSDGQGGYSYETLLLRVYDEIKQKNPNLSSTEGARNEIPAPLIEKYGSKKTAVANFLAICNAIHRTMEEVKDYIDKELSTTGSIDSGNCLILKLQNVKSIQFEGIIIKYVDEFVKCHSCKKINTALQKEDRIMVLKCNLCQASRTVTSGGSAYHAVTGKRSKIRAAAAL